MQLEAEPAPPNPSWHESLRTDWPGFIVPFMHNVFTEPDSADVIAEMIAIGLEATPEVAVAQELELGWQQPARLLDRVTCPTLVVHGEADAPVPVALAQEHRRRDAERTARADPRRWTPPRHPHPGARRPDLAGLPHRSVAVRLNRNCVREMKRALMEHRTGSGEVQAGLKAVLSTPSR
jgi:hypothetical protein